MVRSHAVVSIYNKQMGYSHTYSDGILADESLQTAGAVAGGKGGTVLYIGAGLAAVVAMVQACRE